MAAYSTRNKPFKDTLSGSTQSPPRSTILLSHEVTMTSAHRMTRAVKSRLPRQEAEIHVGTPLCGELRGFPVLKPPSPALVNLKGQISPLLPLGTLHSGFSRTTAHRGTVVLLKAKATLYSEHFIYFGVGGQRLGCSRQGCSV